MADDKSCEGKVKLTSPKYETNGHKGLPKRPRPPKPPSTKKDNPIGDIKVKVDLSDNIKQLKALQREAKKATAALKGLESYPGTKTTTKVYADEKVIEEFEEYSLLTIDLVTLDSVPRVFYKGEEITGKIHVGFDWSTQTDKTVPSPKIDIEYADTGSSRPSTKRISHNPYGGETDE